MTNPFSRTKEKIKDTFNERTNKNLTEKHSFSPPTLRTYVISCVEDTREGSIL